MENKYWLRWRYEYSDGKPTVRGQWCGGNEGDATKVSQENLAFAMVEAKNLVTRDVSVLYACDAADFVIFQWMAALFCGVGGSGSIGRRIEGLRIISRDESIEVLINGDVQIWPRQDHNFNFKSLMR